MDFLDPKKQFRHRIILMTGYVLIAMAILIGTTVLVEESRGFGIGKNGQVIQSGLLFFSSQPNPAHIYLNGVLNKSQTNSRLTVPSGQYTVKLTRSGYRNWQRNVTVQGDDVQHFDYPFLFPSKLTTTKLATYTAAPSVVTQSPDQRWLLASQPGSLSSFDMYDLKNPKQAATTVTLPSGLLSKATTAQTLQVIDWADDNIHVLLEHTYDGKTEFILLDREDPDSSINLDKTFNSAPTSVTLNNRKYDQYYLYNSATDELDTATLKTTTPTLELQHVLAYKSYGDSTLLYATTDTAPTGKVAVDLLDGGKTYTIRQVAANTMYLLNMTTYSGTPYVVIGAASENNVYIYKDPVSQTNDTDQAAPTAMRVLHVTNPTFVSFSPNAQFIMAESGTQFDVFDAQYNRAYLYTMTQPLDAPQAHASWMDGDRLTYVSNNKLVVFDYDQANVQTLQTSNPNYLPFFSPDYHYVYSLSPPATTPANSVELDQTGLLTSADL